MSALPRGATLAGYLPHLRVPVAPAPAYQAPHAPDLGMTARPPVDLTGRDFGLVHVEGLVVGTAGRPGRWRWRCRCGRPGTTTTYDLEAGNRKTCGRRACRIALRREATP